MVRWVPMESNPDVWNSFLTSLGVESKWRFTDVWGLDPEMLAMVPQPVAAVILLYPISENTEKFGREKVASSGAISDEVFFMKQTVGNACGTVGIVHSLLNNTNRIDVGDTLKTFYSRCDGVSYDDRAKLLEESDAIASKHQSAAETGQTAPPSADERVNLHFVAFVSVNGSMYELDGRKEQPVNWGCCTDNELLGCAAKACQEYMACDPGDLRFTVVALSGGD